MSRRLRREGGQDLIEYALILPVLAVLLFGILEFALIMFTYNTIGNAAREGARFGSVHCSSFHTACGANDPEVIAATRGLTTGLNQATLTINQPAPSGGAIQVQVSYRVNLVPAILGSPSINLQARSTMQTE